MGAVCSWGEEVVGGCCVGHSRCDSVENMRTFEYALRIHAVNPMVGLRPIFRTVFEE